MPANERLQQLISDTHSNLEDHERACGLRRRARRKEQQVALRRTLTALICDVANLYLSGGGAIHVCRSKQFLGRLSRYDAPARFSGLPALLDRLAALGYVTQEIGKQGSDGEKGWRTTVAAGPLLASRFRDLNLSPSDLREDLNGETIILKREKVDHWDAGGTLEFRETAEIQAHRENMLRINTWLANADLELLDGCDRRRMLKRYFSVGRFDCGGRLFGGFWQRLPKERRLEDLFIDGEEIVELDFDQMAPTILYGRAGERPPRGDLYEVPGFERCRAGIKLVMNALSFADGLLSQFPRGTRKLFPKNADITNVMGAIEETHRPIWHLLKERSGYRAMFTESEVLVGILIRLIRQGVTALPVHDALMVPASRAAQVADTMRTTFEEHVGVPIGVTPTPA